MRPIFCGNMEFDARQSDVERLFRRYGRVDRVDMKSGFAFVYMEDERDAEDAIRKLDRIEFGRKGRRLRVEWTKQERGGRRPDSSRKSSGSSRPSKTLFVINFDPVNTRTRDIERHFEQYGKISNVRIRRNFAFVQYELQEDATKALEATHMSNFMDRVISVEYAIRDDEDKRNGYSPDRRGRDASPDRRGYGRRERSRSPYRREKDSPDYGHGSVPNARSERRNSPDYGRAGSPANDRFHSRSPPAPERSVPNSRPNRRNSPEYARDESPANDRSHSRSPPARERSVPNSRPEGRNSPDYARAESPANDKSHSRSPPARERSVPNSRPQRSNSPDYAGAESPANDRYPSRSPPARERSRS